MRYSGPYKGKHVLILEGYCKQCLPFIRGFKEQGCEVSVLCGSKLDCSYASRLPDHKILGTCDIHKPEESERYIIDLIKTGHFDLTFSPFDFSSRILAHNKELLSPFSIIYANDKAVFDAANDKNQVMRICMDNGIPCPETAFDIKSVDELKERGMLFPLIIKPRSMYGARGFHVFHTLEEMEEYVINRGNDLSGYVIQEFIPARSRVIGANIFIDRDGQIKSSYLYACEHLYPEEGGTSTLNAILIRDDIRESCEKLVKLMGLRGIVGVDLMLDVRDNVGKVIEINPRPVHGISLGFFSGINHAKQVLQDAFGDPVELMTLQKTDICSRIMQTDVLWFLSSPDRFKRSARRLGYKIKEQMIFWDDPLPWFAFLLAGVRDYRIKMREKRQ